MFRPSFLHACAVKRVLKAAPAIASVLQAASAALGSATLNYSTCTKLIVGFPPSRMFRAIESIVANDAASPGSTAAKTA